MYIRGVLGTGYFHLNVIRQVKRVLADGYCEAGISIKRDEEGLTRIAPFDTLSGLTITVKGAGENPEIRYSGNSHIPQMALNELWKEPALWPKKRDGAEVDIVGKNNDLGVTSRLEPSSEFQSAGVDQFTVQNRANRVAEKSLIWSVEE